METGNGTEQEVETGHMTESYLNILQESLEKKLQVMAEIQKYSLLQQEIFQSEEADLEKYDEYVDKKDELLEKLTALDNGFETLYKGLSEELQGNRERYAGQIRRLQELVTKVTEDSVAIQAQEKRNKKLVEDYFRRARAGIAQNRRSSRAAYDYYRSMSGSGVETSQLYDTKK